MKYEAAIQYLENLGKFGIRLGMERIEALLKELGNPEQQVKFVHVTGTNGKGSVSSMIADILLASGVKTGKFISPHLVRYNERIELNGQPISDEEFAAIITSVKVAAECITQKGVDQPTQFEILTAAAFLCFAQNRLDYAIVEVGLGGLWDSTNVMLPVVAVITNVSLDHTDRIGKTIEEIAMQKAGIIKEGVPVVTAATENALGPIKAMSLFKQAPLYIYGNAFTTQLVSSNIKKQLFTLSAGDYHSNYEIKLLGAHQLINAAVAIVAAKLVSKQDARITEEALHQGVSVTRWPGRLEVVKEKPDLILDGAHNPAGAKALRAALDQYYSGKVICFIFGMMGDKDTASVENILFQPGDKVIAVKADGGDRAAEATTLAREIGETTLTETNLPAAYAKALSLVPVDGVICVCGSLYLVGNFKKQVLNE
ncbi:MAG TPA: bifunctional folylpolyglutamate synthase/dihydrofolate synthase [Candidatus Avacidaminococcus intestinavium]|uniref:tetrahydrofolate synthase n=1 Tax=Candidatus Avacidaminococcus intestinavium TaxID=2840684 RepID=A0A9D1SKX7_9FIRM|nr:bifunctional folylpolyglutamate synthase/dihydrofolate synthase [Candidatus Avacidaminococcus intestinavium]